MEKEDSDQSDPPAGGGPNSASSGESELSGPMGAPVQAEARVLEVSEIKETVLPGTPDPSPSLSAGQNSPTSRTAWDCTLDTNVAKEAAPDVRKAIAWPKKFGSSFNLKGNAPQVESSTTKQTPLRQTAEEEPDLHWALQEEGQRDKANQNGWVSRDKPRPQVATLELTHVQEGKTSLSPVATSPKLVLSRTTSESTAGESPVSSPTGKATFADQNNGMPKLQSSFDMQRESSHISFYDETLFSESCWVFPSLGQLFWGATILSMPAKPILLTPEKKAYKAELREGKPPVHVRFRLQKKQTNKEFQRFSPNSRFVQHWMMLMVLPLAYEIWAFPFRLAFGTPGASCILFYSDVACDCMFLLDFIIFLLTTIPAGTYPNQEMQLSTTKRIAKVYARNIFPFQILPSVVYYVVSVIMSDICLDICWIWWLSTVPRVVPRSWRLVQYFRSMVNNLSVSVRTLQGIKFSLILFLSAHWVGCIFYFLARLQHQTSRRTWVYDFEDLLPLYRVSESTISMDYLLCIYKGFNALSNLEYDYGLPSNWVEMIWSLLVMGLQVYMSALILGTLLNYLVSKDPVAEAHKKKLENLNTYCEAKQLPYDLRERLYKYFDFQYKKNCQYKAGASMDLPRSLQIKVADCKYRSMIEKCSLKGNLFHGCDKHFLNSLLVHLKVVHLMPNEEVVEKGGLPRELYFVFDGTVQVLDDENRVKRVVRNDVPDMAPVVGEVAFFMGIHAPHSIRARPDGDVQLLVLSREKADELFVSYPEMYELVSENVLSCFGLDVDGDPLDNAQEDTETDPDTIHLKEILVSALKRKAHNQFSEMLFAAQNGDQEKVELLLRQGVAINSVDYDGNSVLHFAAADGNYRLTEMLLDRLADRNLRNRWGVTPLQEAINHKQSLVAGLLSAWKAKIEISNPAEALCQAASDGDIETLRRLVENGIDVNGGDYDGRTALHLSAAEGQDKIVEYLVSKKADVNIKDRWGGTPLADAAKGGHSALAAMLRSKGAKMPEGEGVEKVCDAASRGDVRQLRLLHNCGEAIDQGDYDDRYPLHLAAAEGKVLAVNFLLSISADPNCTDRWKMRPLDDALRGGTLYHQYCAKLIHCWGGNSTQAETDPEMKEALANLKGIKLSEVRQLIKRLIAEGYDDRTPSQQTARDVKVTFQSVMRTIPLVQQLKGEVSNVCRVVQEKTSQARDLIESLKISIIETASHIEEDQKSGGTEGMPSSTKFHRPKPQLTKDLSVMMSGQELEGTSRPKSLVSKCINVLNTLNNLDETTEMSDDEAAMVDGLDSDEEAILWKEIDALVEVQEKAERAGVTGDKIAAQEFQRAALKIIDLGCMFDALCAIVHEVKKSTETDVEPSLNPEELAQFLNVLGQNDVDQVERDEMFQEGQEYHVKFGKNPEDRKPSRSLSASQKGNHYIPISSLLAGSAGFRKLLSSINIDQDLCSLLETRIAETMSEFEMRTLLPLRRRRVKDGELVFDPLDDPGFVWWVISSGECKVIPLQEDTPSKYDVLVKGDCFGAWAFLLQEEENPPFQIKAEGTVEILELPLEPLWELMMQQSTTFKAPSLARLMGEAPMPKSKKKPMAGKSAKGRSRGRDNGQVRKNSHVRKSVPNLKDAFLVVDAPVMVGESEKQALRELIRNIDGLWTAFAMGSSTFSRHMLRNIHKLLGEVSSECFKKMFFPATESELAETITVELFWKSWIDFLAEEVFGSEQTGENDEGTPEIDPSQQGNLVLNEDPIAAEKDQVEEYEEIGMLEKLHAALSSNRSLKQRFFETEVVEQYEHAWEKVCVSKDNPLYYSRIPVFLTHLFVDFGYRMTDKNVKEFLTAFGKDADECRAVVWSEVSKVLKDRRHGNGDLYTGPMIRSALNPTWSMLVRWEILMRLCAVYYVIMVPVRISFLPFDSMLSFQALLSDGIVDALVFCNLVVKLNTAYKNGKSAWVVNRLKILRKIPYAVTASAIPFDWIVYLLGADLETANWFRLPKVLFIQSHTIRLVRAQSAATIKLENMARLIAITLHWSACLWFYIGRKFHKTVSWYVVEAHLQDETFSREDLYGFSEDSTVWDRYLLSFYWCSATLTVNGLIGDVIPQNWLEICFTIVMMVLNLTIIKWVLGEISTMIMHADDDIVKTREQLEMVESFIHSYSLPEDLQSEIRAHYDSQSTGISFDQSEIFAGMSHTLQIEVASFVSREYLEGVELLKGCSDRLLDIIAVMLIEVQFAPGDFIFEESEAADDMYFIMTGLVEEVTLGSHESEYIVERTMKFPGSLGGLAFVFGMRHYFSARASKTESVTCLRLSRDHYTSVMKLFHEEEEIISQNAINLLESVDGGKVQSRMGQSFKSGRSAGAKSGKSARSRKSAKSKASAATSGKSGQLLDEDSEEDLIQRVDSGAVAEQGGQEEEEECSEDHDTLSYGDGAPSAVGDDGGGANKVAALKARRQNQQLMALLTASAEGHLEEVSKLLESNEKLIRVADSKKRTALHIAASNGMDKVVSHLINAGADIKAKDIYSNTAFNDAVRHRRDSTCKVIRELVPDIRYELKGKAVAVELCQTAFEGDALHLKRLVTNGASVNDADYDGRTALHLASCEGHLHVVKFLIKQKANIDAQDNFGGTALLDAVRHQHSEVQAFLRNQGAELETGGTDFAVKLCCAAAEGDLKTLQTLASNGVALNVGDYDGRTCLHLASANGRVAVLEYLVSLAPAINLNPVDRYGETPLDDAVRQDRKTAIAMLQEQGALAKGNEALEELLCTQEAEAAVRESTACAPLVQHAFEHSPENSVLQWMLETLEPTLREKTSSIIESIQRLQWALQKIASAVAGIPDTDTPVNGGLKTENQTPLGVFRISAMQLVNSPFIAATTPVLNPKQRKLSQLSQIERGDQMDKTKAAEQILLFIAEVKSGLIDCINVLEASSGNAGVPIECKVWTMVGAEYKSQTRKLKVHLRALSEMCRLSKKLMKEIIRAEARKLKAQQYSKNYRNLRPSKSLRKIGIL